jgi:hypothetical protein
MRDVATDPHPAGAFAVGIDQRCTHETDLDTLPSGPPEHALLPVGAVRGPHLERPSLLTVGQNLFQWATPHLLGRKTGDDLGAAVELHDPALGVGGDDHVG